MSRETDWRGKITGKEEETEAEEGRKGLRGGAAAGRKRLGGKRKSRGSETATCI